MKLPSPIKRLKEELSHCDENVIRPTVLCNGYHDAACSSDHHNGIPHVSRTAIAKDNCNVSPRPLGSRDSHFKECIRLHSAKKIDEKNAFSLYLIDYVHSMLMDGKMRNFQAAAPILAAGTTIYAARVDAVHSLCRNIASKLSHARLSSAPSPSTERTPPSSDDSAPTLVSTPATSSPSRRNHRAARPRLLTSANLTRARLSKPPYDDLLFRQGAASGDQTLSDQAKLHGIVGAEGEEPEEDLRLTVRVHFDPRLLRRGLQICPEVAGFVFLPEPVPLLRPCCVSLSPLELIKLSDVKQELKEKEEMEEEEGDPPEELCLPHVVSVTGAAFPEITCQSVEEYVSLLRANLANLHSLPPAGDLPGLLRLQRRSARKRSQSVAFVGQQAACKRRRATQAPLRKRRTVVSRRVKLELRERVPELEEAEEAEEPPVELPVELEEEENDCKMSDLSSDSEGDLLMSEPRFALDMFLSRPSPSRPSVDVSGLIRWLRRFLTVKNELGATRRFAWILERARSATRQELSPAMLLFALLHVAERERLQLRESGSDIEVCPRTC